MVGLQRNMILCSHVNLSSSAFYNQPKGVLNYFYACSVLYDLFLRSYELGGGNNPVVVRSIDALGMAGVDG